MNQIERRSLRDRAYDEIKRLIITLGYKPGEYLNEARISDELQIGRTPVHQALDRLMRDGLVEVIPRKGVIVKPISVDDVVDLVEVRQLNEPYFTALAAERATADEIAEMRRVLANEPKGVPSDDPEAAMLADRTFHDLIAKASKNPVFMEFVRPLHDRILRFWFVSLSRKQQLHRVEVEHADILEAIVARDAEKARHLMHEHIVSFKENIVSMI